jgi:hypothetical protein
MKQPKIGKRVREIGASSSTEENHGCPVAKKVKK